jgi:hypothetical protein
MVQVVAHDDDGYPGYDPGRGVLGLVAAHLPLHLREQAIQGVLAFPACRRRCLLEIEIR